MVSFCQNSSVCTWLTVHNYRLMIRRQDHNYYFIHHNGIIYAHNHISQITFIYAISNHMNSHLYIGLWPADYLNVFRHIPDSSAKDSRVIQIHIYCIPIFISKCMATQYDRRVCCHWRGVLFGMLRNKNTYFWWGIWSRSKPYLAMRPHHSEFLYTTLRNVFCGVEF